MRNTKTRKYIWTFSGLIFGFAIMMYRFIEDIGGYISNSPPWIILVLPLTLSFFLPLILGGIGLIIDIKITNKDVKKISVNQLISEKIPFNFKYTRNAAIICFIYSIITGPTLIGSSGMFRDLGYLVLNLPASFISYPFLDLFWPLLEDPPDIVTILVTALFFSIEGFIIGFIIPNAKSTIAFILKYKRKILLYSVIIVLCLMISLFLVRDFVTKRENLVWKQYALDLESAEYCDIIKDGEIHTDCVTEVAVKRGDPNDCMVTRTGGPRIQCYSQVSISLNDVGICELGEFDSDKAGCIKNYAIAKGNRSLCENITYNHALRDWCYRD